MTKLGKIVLMGSGELTETMVEVHKALLRPYGVGGKAVFLDTPAGFQVNVDLISKKAVDYFNTRIQHPLTVASFKSADAMTGLETGGMLDALNNADYIFMGPGSPTYALKQWQPSPVPRIMVDRLTSGACLVAASAAALAMGRLTLPVYEIYKAGQAPFWVDGLDITSRIGWGLAVVPHWNNQEGGNHDTRFCFMGEQRLIELEKQLPENVAILGIDEHTAVIFDLEKQTLEIRGRGRVTLRGKGCVRIFEKGNSMPLDVLEQESSHLPAKRKGVPEKDVVNKAASLKDLQVLASRISQSPLSGNIETDTRRLLDIAERIRRQNASGAQWETLDAVLDIFRELLMVFSRAADASPKTPEAGTAPLMDQLVESIIALRDRMREQKEWKTADELRDCLQQANVIVTDTADGTRWRWNQFQ